jgi:hypothetical protein
MALADELYGAPPSGLAADLYGTKPKFQRVPDALDNPNMATEGMSGAQKFTAGMGGAFQNIIDAVPQLFGQGPDAGQVQDRQRIDAPLNQTGAGLLGNIAGNVAAFAPLALVPGANTVAGSATLGALAGSLTPTGGVVDRLKNMATGFGLGGGTQLVARYPMETLDAAKNIFAAPFKGVKAAFEPLYESGRNQILSRVLRESTGGNPNVEKNLLAGGELVPGSLPTAAEVGQSPGLAAMQRSAAAVNPEAYATRAAQQNEARVRALRDMAGTGGQREFYDAARTTAADQLYKVAYKEGVDLTVNATTGVPLSVAQQAARKGEITKLMNTPALKAASAEASNMMANDPNLKGQLLDPSGSVQGLHYTRRALSDMIKDATPGSDNQRILTSLLKRFDTTLDTISPQYANARVTFREMSKPINQMDVAQELADKSIKPLNDIMQPDAFARNLTDAMAARATKFKNATLAGVMEPQQLQTLNALKEDLARSVAARDMGRGPGSDSTQKLAMTNLMQRLGLPQGVLNVPLAGRLGNWLYESADARMKQQLADALLNPQETARLMQSAPRLAPPLVTPTAMGNNSALLARMLSLPSSAMIGQER